MYLKEHPKMLKEIRKKVWDIKQSDIAPDDKKEEKKETKKAAK